MADNVIVRVPEQQFIRGEDGYSPEVTIEDIAHGHRITITDREHPEGQTADVLDGDSAYEQAVAGGYEGTEAQFNEELASFKELSEQAADSAQQAASGASTAQHYMNSAWNAVNSANLAKVSAESAAAQALIRMNSADASAQAAAETATTFTEQTVPAAVNTINEAKADALTAAGNAQTTAVSAVQTESTTQQAAIQQKGEDTIASIPSDYTELTEDVDNLKSANQYVIKTKFPDTFEAVPFASSGGFGIGRINVNTGANQSSTTRARRYNSILSGNYVSLGTDDYEYTLFYYNGIGSSWADTYTHVYSAWIPGSVWTLIDDSIGDRARIVVRHPDDSTISDGDLDILTRVCVARDLNQITPQITTKKGNPVYIGELEALARDWYSHRNDIVSGSKAMVYGNNSILNTSSYTREIDCSTFVGMLLRGYSFSQTPYATGQGASPDSWTGNTAYNWTFNPFDYSNYSRIDSQSRTKVRYASQMAEMMIERGQSVPIDRYYANIEPGDVLFFARHDSTTNDWFEPLRFKHINHVAICIAKEKATSADGWDTATYPWKHTFAEVGHEDETTPDGVIKIRTLEQPQGDTSAIFENNINTLCLVCRPDLGSISDDTNGVFEKGTLPANTDLNTFTDIGLYRIPSGNSVLPTLVNYPSSNPGRLLVLSDENGYYCTQVVITSGNVIFTRVQTSTSNHTWTGWASYDETVVRTRAATKNENDRYDADLTLTNGVYSISPTTAAKFDNLPSEYAGVLLVFGSDASRVQIYINRYGTVYYRFKYWANPFYEWYRPLKPDTTLSLAGAAADAKTVGDSVRSGYVHDGDILRMSTTPEAIPVNENHMGYNEFISSTWDTLLPTGYQEGDAYNASTTKIHGVKVERASSWTSTPYGTNVDTYTIYRYIFTPQNGYDKTLFLTSGCHGNEAEAYWGLYRLVRMIYFDGHKYPTLRNLRDCRLIIIPSWNPWGFQHYRRYNAFSALNTGSTDVAKNYQAWAWLMASNHEVTVNGTVYDISQVGEANVIWQTLQDYGDSINLWLDLHTDPYAGRDTTNVDIDDPRGVTPPYGCYGFSAKDSRGYRQLFSVMYDFYNILEDEYQFTETWHPQPTNPGGSSFTGWMAQFGFASGVVEISTFMDNFPYASGSAGMMKLAQEYYGNCITEMLR